MDPVLQKIQPPFSIPDLPDDEVRGEALQFLNHLQLLHEDETIGLACRHLELLQDHKGHESIQHNSCNQYHVYDHPGPSRHRVFPVADSRQGGDDYLKALNEVHPSANYEEAVREEDDHDEVDEQDP